MYRHSLITAYIDRWYGRDSARNSDHGHFSLLQSSRSSVMHKQERCSTVRGGQFPCFSSPRFFTVLMATARSGRATRGTVARATIRCVSTASTSTGTRLSEPKTRASWVPSSWTFWTSSPGRTVSSIAVKPIAATCLSLKKRCHMHNRQNAMHDHETNCLDTDCESLFHATQSQIQFYQI